MQGFRPKIKLQKFRPDSNLCEPVFFFTVSLEALATQEQVQKQAQEHGFLFYRKNGLDTRTSEASTIGSRSNFSFFLHLLLLQHFLVKTEHEAEDQRVLLSCIFINHSCTRSGFVRFCTCLLYPPSEFRGHIGLFLVSIFLVFRS